MWSIRDQPGPHLRHFLLGGSPKPVLSAEAATGHSGPRTYMPPVPGTTGQSGKKAHDAWPTATSERVAGEPAGACALPASSRHASGALPAGEGSRMSARAPVGTDHRWPRASEVTRSTVHVGRTQLRRACLARAKAQPSRSQLHIGCGHGRGGRVDASEGPAHPLAAPRRLLSWPWARRQRPE
jgi:hypothetical protein